MITTSATGWHWGGPDPRTPRPPSSLIVTPTFCHPTAVSGCVIVYLLQACDLRLTARSSVLEPCTGRKAAWRHKWIPVDNDDYCIVRLLCTSSHNVHTRPYYFVVWLRLFVEFFFTIFDTRVQFSSLFTSSDIDSSYHCGLCCGPFRSHDMLFMVALCNRADHNIFIL